MYDSNILFRSWIETHNCQQHFVPPLYGSNNILFRQWVENVWLQKHFVPQLDRDTWLPTFCSATVWLQHFIPPLGGEHMAPNNILFRHWLENVWLQQHFVPPLYGPEQHFIPPLGRKCMAPTTFCSATPSNSLHNKPRAPFFLILCSSSEVLLSLALIRHWPTLCLSVVHLSLQWNLTAVCDVHNPPLPSLLWFMRSQQSS